MIPTPRRPSTRTLVSVLLAAGVTSASQLSAQEAEPVARWYRGLRELAPDPARGAVVEGLSLERDAGTLHFDHGQVHLLQPIDGREIGAVFVGEGRFEMSTPEPTEQGQLARAFGAAELSEPFRAAVLLATDFTVPELSAALSWAPLEPHGDATRELREARDYFTDGDGWVSSKLLAPLLNQSPGFFYAHVSEDRGDPMIFSVDPHVFEEVSLSKRAEGAKSGEVVAQFHRAADYATGRSVPQEGLDLISISAYDIETAIDDDLELVGRATATLTRRFDAPWIPFLLYPELEVDSIRWHDGSSTTWYRAEDSADLWIEVASAPAEESRLTVHYAGDMMERPRDLWVILETHTNWYPVYEFGRPIPYHLTFHVPEDYTVATVGSLVAESTTDEVTTTVWETGPVRMLTFNLGEFDAYESVEPGAPPLEVLINESAHRRLEGMVADAGGLLLGQRDMAESVALDVRNSFRFYDEVFGPTTVESFVATEIPYGHGEAYPGLVMLSWDTFQWTTDQGFDEMFRAHEVAHQWWGISVRPATYRDWWLAEGFSEFSGWWYAARARGSAELYFRRLRETREAILERRDEAPPIGLGRRASSSEHPEDYQLTVYYKAAWVLHMLRTMLTDADTGNDDAFVRVMKTFYESHVGGTASTLAFQQTVEEVVGADMGWFFEQWIHGTAIPTYVFSYDLEEQPDGQVSARVRIRQEGVPEDFRMIVPILVDCGDEGSALVPVNVTGPVTEGDLPLLPREPDAIVLNPYESVLAETRTERWRD